MTQTHIDGFYSDFIENTATCLAFYMKLNSTLLDVKLILKKPTFVKYLCTFLNNMKDTDFEEGFMRIKPRTVRKVIKQRKNSILNRYYKIMTKKIKGYRGRYVS